MKNLQGDVVQIRSIYGTVVVEYTYDAWGNVLSITGMYADTLGVNNPIRYRGYYQDFETGFYYLQSRYYDPAIRRFINADRYINANGDMLGYNMYAYCGNNPVNNIDPSGEFIMELSLFGYALLALGMFIVGTMTTVAVIDGLVQAPPSISIPKIESKPKVETKEKDKTLAPSIPRNEQELTLYRGGNNMTPRAGEYVLDDGLVQPVTNKGVSLNINKNKVSAYGIPHKVVSVPTGLIIYQQGLDPGHYIIAPAYAMTLEEYQNLLNMVILIPEY